MHRSLIPVLVFVSAVRGISTCADVRNAFHLEGCCDEETSALNVTHLHAFHNCSEVTSFYDRNECCNGDEDKPLSFPAPAFCGGDDTAYLSCRVDRVYPICLAYYSSENKDSPPWYCPIHDETASQFVERVWPDGSSPIADMNVFTQEFNKYDRSNLYVPGLTNWEGADEFLRSRMVDEHTAANAVQYRNSVEVFVYSRLVQRTVSEPVDFEVQPAVKASFQLGRKGCAARQQPGLSCDVISSPPPPPPPSFPAGSTTTYQVDAVKVDPEASCSCTGTYTQRGFTWNEITNAYDVPYYSGPLSDSTFGKLECFLYRDPSCHDGRAPHWRIRPHNPLAQLSTGDFLDFSKTSEIAGPTERGCQSSIFVHETSNVTVPEGTFSLYSIRTGEVLCSTTIRSL